jgi:SagB-type dehydrogenase family enzyme
MAGIKTDAVLGLEKPAAKKQVKDGERLIKLASPSKDIVKCNDTFDNIKSRRSVRNYSDEAISFEELSYLLWASFGVTDIDSKGNKKRAVPSGGACYPIETYIIVRNVKGLEQGIYRYRPLDNELAFIKSIDKMQEVIESFMLDSKQPYLPGFANGAAVLFAWSAVPYRGEYKFNIMTHKKILIDVGHICQNLYIASESIDAGTCAIGIYDQDRVDALLDLDGEDEFVIYLAAVGKKK